ncbi:hypothetical protein IW262DRAFT_1334897 [Armillaria fumosa]|nr:hypothetical protein IW262DRAFT_1334897 [Armillaria fumosa]
MSQFGDRIEFTSRRSRQGWCQEIFIPVLFASALASGGDVMLVHDVMRAIPASGTHASSTKFQTFESSLACRHRIASDANRIMRAQAVLWFIEFACTGNLCWDTAYRGDLVWMSYCLVSYTRRKPRRIPKVSMHLWDSTNGHEWAHLRLRKTTKTRNFPVDAAPCSKAPCCTVEHLNVDDMFHASKWEDELNPLTGDDDHQSLHIIENAIVLNYRCLQYIALASAAIIVNDNTAIPVMNHPALLQLNHGLEVIVTSGLYEG